jgi:hypothetical protein
MTGTRSATVKEVTPLATAVSCLLAGHLLLGIAHVAILPPWEGFDETAHYSYLQQLADRGELPRLGTARMSTDVERYTRVAPLPYSNVPPFEKNGGLTYKTFFARSTEVLAGTRAFIHGPPGEARRYAAGRGMNWQAQHPPLYYLVLSPVYLATRHLSWAMHLFSLRLASYLLAWAALILGVYACATTVPSGFGGSTAAPSWAMLGIAVWPTLLPSWFPEMARLGNDSLAALILAGLWLVVVRAVGTELSVTKSLALGALLGAGCLTKAFFVPVTVGVLAFWIVRVWMLTGTSALAPMALRLGILLLVTGSIAGWWYFENWQDYGVALGSETMIKLRNAGGLISGLGENFTLTAWVRVHLVAGPASLPLPGPDDGHRAPHGGRLPGGPSTIPAECCRVAAGLARGSDGVGVQRPCPRPRRADRRGKRNEWLLPSLPDCCPRHRPGTRGRHLVEP